MAHNPIQRKNARTYKSSGIRSRRRSLINNGQSEKTCLTMVCLAVVAFLVSVDLAKGHQRPFEDTNLESTLSTFSKMVDADAVIPFASGPASEQSMNPVEISLWSHNRNAPFQSWTNLLGTANSVSRGDRISINGRSIPSPWSQQDGSIFIPDAYLIEEMGLDLLSSDDASQQPVQWFSDTSETPPISRTAFDGQFRYLNIADLAQQQGWRIQAQGSVLAIETPPSQIRAVRHGKQSWGDRIVIDLDQPTPFQVDRASGNVIVTLDAVLPEGIQLPSASTTNTVSSIATARNGDRTVLDIDFSLQKQARVWSVPSPPRLIVDITSNAVVDKSIQWLPGLWWRQQQVRVGSATFPVVFLEIDPSHTSDIGIQPIWSNPSAMPGIAPLTTTASQRQAVAAINGGFFNRNNQLPLGAIRQDGQWYSGPILNRGAIAWNHAGDMKVGRLSLQDTIRLPSGQQFPSLHLNSGYVQAGLSRYTSTWGASYTPLTDFETLITVRQDQVIHKQLFERAGSRSVPIPQDGYVIAARSYRTAANAMPIGASLQSNIQSLPPEFDAYRHIMGAGPLLIQNRQIVVNAQLEGFSSAFAQQRAPRSAIAKTTSGHLLFVTVQNRTGGPGPSLPEMAHILYQMGALDALNLDGGNSTSLYLGGRLINRSPRTAARVHNGIGVFVNRLNPSTDE